MTALDWILSALTAVVWALAVRAYHQGCRDTDAAWRRRGGHPVVDVSLLQAQFASARAENASIRAAWGKTTADLDATTRALAEVTRRTEGGA